MTMDHEVVEDGCKNCSVLRNEIDKRTVQLENSNAQQLAGFLTLKQKIIGTDKLIREYQSSKVECDILTRKNEEFVHLIDQLHRDLSTRNQEYAQIYGSMELLKKANADYEIKFKELHDEAQKWKSQAEAGENFTSQLVAKVKVLEKYEEEVKHTASVSRECEKMESKVKVMKGQLKEAKEITNKSKKEISKLQKEYNILVKYAKKWGEMIEEQGKFNTYQQKFYSKLCNGDNREDDDVDQDDIEGNETDKQSKLLEQLLGEEDGSDSMISPTDILPSNAELSKCRRQSPDKFLPSKQVKQTRFRAQRRGSQDNATPSVSGDKTPTRGAVTRKRTRTSSHNSIPPTSDAVTATESEKEHKKLSGPRTRSSGSKIPSLPELKEPEPIPTSDPMNVIAEKSLPEFIVDIPCQSTMGNILQLEPTPVKPLNAEQHYSKKKEYILSLSSSDSKSELKLSTKSSGDVAIPIKSTSSFGFESSSDSDMEMIPVPKYQLRSSSSIDTSCSGINRVPCSIFALEADLDLSSSESEAEVPNHKEARDSDTEAVDTSQVEKKTAEQSDEIPEAQITVLLNMVSEAPPVPLEKNIGSVNASSEEVSPVESEMPEPSEENEEFSPTEKRVENLPSEQTDWSLILESGNKPKMVDDQHETEQMVVNEKTRKDFSLEEASTHRPEEESKSDNVDKLLSTKSPVEIQVTKLTEENQRDDLEMAINVGKRLACAELIAASSEKLGDQFSVEIGKQMSIENRNQDSEALVVDEKELSNDFSVEIENRKSVEDFAASFDGNSEKELREEDVVVPLGYPKEDQAANVEPSNTNQFEIGLPKPMDDNQEFQAMVSENPEKEFPTKQLEDQLTIGDTAAEFTTESFSAETDLVESKEDDQASEVVTVSDNCQEKLFVSEVDDNFETLQEDSMPNVAESLFQVETDVLKPVEDIKKTQPAVSDQFETGLPKLMENNKEFQAMDSEKPEKEFPIKLQEDQLAMGDNGTEFSTKNLSVETSLVESKEDSQAFEMVSVSDKWQEKLFVSEIEDPLETVQEDSMPKITVLTLLQVEVEGLKPVEDNQKSQAVVSNQPEKELLHEVEDLLDKPEQGQRSVVDSNVESLHQTLVVDTGGPKKNIKDFEAAIVDDQCNKEPVEDNKKSHPAVSDRLEKDLLPEVEDFLDEPEQVQRSIFDVESLNQSLVVDIGGPMKNIQDFGAAEVEDQCDKEPEEDKKLQPAASDQPERELIREVEDSLDKPEHGQRSIVDSNVESLNQTLAIDTGEKKIIREDSGAAVVDDRGDKELFDSKAADPVETLQEESETNAPEPSRSTEDLEFEVLKSTNNKLPIEIEKEANHETESDSVCRITESRKEIDSFVPRLDKQGVHSIPVNEIFSDKSNPEIDVEPGIISDLEDVQELPVVSTLEETVSRASLQIIRQAISGQISESSRKSSKEKCEIGNAPVNRDAYPSLFNPPAVTKQICIERNNRSVIDPSKSSEVSQILEAPSAFKVPRVPITPPRILDANLHSNFSWSKNISHVVKRSAVDDEVAVILKQVRTNIIELPTTISPLPKSPEPQPIVPKKIEEPKSRFPVLPRCAFNWTGKKLPMSDKLTERFGGYLHPGVQVRVRFRKVSHRLRDMRSPDILSYCFQGVTNFAEAERRHKQTLSPVPFIEDIADEVEPEKEMPEPALISSVCVTQSRKLSERRPLRPNSLVSTQSVTDVEAPQKNSKLSITAKAKAITPVSRSKAAVPDLFGSDSSSSESECESDAVPPPNQERLSISSTSAIPSPVQECLIRPSTIRNLKEQQPEPGSGSKQSSHLSNSSRTQALVQLVEPIISSGKGSRTGSFVPAKQNELRRDLNSPSTDQTRCGLGLGRGVKPTQLIISPCSESLLSAVGKAKTPVGRVIAPLKRPFKQPEVPTAPVLQTPYLPDSSTPLNEIPSRKRISHTLKRNLEHDAADPDVLPASKRGRPLPEVTPPAVSLSAPVPDEFESEEIPISARTRQKRNSSCPINLQEVVQLNVKNAPSKNQKIRQKSTEKSPNDGNKRFKRLVVESSTSESENEMEVNKGEMGQSSSAEENESIFKKLDKSDQGGSSNEKGRSAVQLPNNSQSPHVEESTEPPEMEESPKSPDINESPKSPDEILLDEHESSNLKTVVEIPTSSPTQSEQNQPSAFELVYNDIQKAPLVQPRGKQTKGNSKLKKEINFVVLKFFKDPEVVDEFLNRLIERVLRPDSMNIPSFIRILISTVIHGWDDLIDLTNTPPAPPMASVHQRCVIVLQKLDESNAKMQNEPNVNPNMMSDLFLSESSAIMFKTEQTLTLEEMCSLSRAYTAVCRSRGCLAKARAFLFDCVYFMPPRSYALAYTIMTVWADVLRQVSFPLGTSCVDQTIAYVLLHNCKVKAVQGISGKVIQARSFLQNTYEYKKTTSTVDDLVDYLMTRFYETNSKDEASSLSWSLALLARWEGVDFAIQVIEKRLWPFLQRWSSGEATNNSAAAVIIAIGMLGKTVPASKRAGVKRVLDAMKVLLQSEGIVPPIQEAAVEAVIHLGETDDPKSIIEIVKSWKIVNTNLSQHMRLVLKAFLKRHSDLCVV